MQLQHHELSLLILIQQPIITSMNNKNTEVGSRRRSDSIPFYSFPWLQVPRGIAFVGASPRSEQRLSEWASNVGLGAWRVRLPEATQYSYSTLRYCYSASFSFFSFLLSQFISPCCSVGGGGWTRLSFTNLH